jgi:D-glycero-D-manno-heptose 1,7-bisphosphate phosphatase
VFLDRDGTINASPTRGEYVTRPEDLKLIDGAALAIRRLNENRIWVGMVTNQRGIALGLMTLEDLKRIHERLFAELASIGAHLDGVYVCPHEEGTCTCRKPLPGLLLEAQREVGGIQFARSAIIGDSWSDVAAGRAAGAIAILLGPTDDDAEADYHAPSLSAALDWLSVPALKATTST